MKYLSLDGLTRFVSDMKAKYGKLASQEFTGTPTAPTAASGTNTTQVATTAFVTDAVSGKIEDGDLSVQTTTSGSISVASGGYTRNTFSIAKSGYTPIGVVGVQMSGSYATYAILSRSYLSGTSYAYQVKLLTGNTSDLTITAYVLYRKN